MRESLKVLTDVLFLLFVFFAGCFIKFLESLAPAPKEESYLPLTPRRLRLVETDSEERDGGGACNTCGKFGCCAHSPCLGCHWCLGIS